MRAEVAAVRRGEEHRRSARRSLGLPEDRPTVVAFGGSLGARRINTAVAELASRWSGRADRSLYHVVGRRDWDGDHGGRTPEGLSLVRVPYEEHMDLAYAAADVAVCRAGAMTVAELAVAGVPAVLVPLPGAPGDHQSANAGVLASAGAAVVVADGACDGATLAPLLDRLLDDAGTLVAMGRAAGSLGRRDAAAAGARLVEQAAAPARSGDAR